jgi:L-aminopeptidase/D-esterase-like protein
VKQGNVGAGAGATVGKLLGMDRAMKGGVGSASITLPGGLTVAALVAVNAFGDIIDPSTGGVVAGVRTPDGRGLADARVLIRTGATQKNPIGENTTIGVVATNARLTKAQATKIAQMAHDGLARAIAPAHTMFDGDTLFAVATGRLAQTADVSLIGALAADVVAEAVLNAVRQATSLAGLPALRDLGATAAGR